MIRIVERDRLPMPRGKPAPPRRDQWQNVVQRLEQWVRTQPGISLLVAATVGAALARLIKRRH